MKKKLLILGASRYYVRSIDAAHELGCEVVVTDRKSDSVGFAHAEHHEVVDITDISGSISVARKYRIDGVLAVNDFGVRTAAAIAADLGLPGLPVDVAERATNKGMMRKAWESTPFSVGYRIVRTPDEALQAAQELGTWPLVLKPADSRGGGSRGVTKVDGPEQLPAALEFAQSFYTDKTAVLEEFIDGIEHSVETLTYRGETHILAISDKVKTPPPYRVDKSVIYPTRIQGENIDRVLQACKTAVKALGISHGAAHVEIATTATGPKLFEIGPRCGGGGTPDPIVPFLTGVSMLKEAIRMALGWPPEHLTPRFQRACVYRFLTPAPGVVRRILGVDEVKNWRNVLDCEMLVKPGDIVNPVKTGGDRAGFVIAGGSTREEALALADAAEAHIRVEYVTPA